MQHVCAFIFRFTQRTEGRGRGRDVASVACVKFNKAQVAERAQRQQAKGDCECGKERRSDKATERQSTVAFDVY